MGDCGSLSLGAAIATISISLHSEIILLIAGILFVLEAISVILQVGYFKLTHKRIFLMAPLHHHYEKKGWEETKVIMLFYLIGSFAALLSIIIEVI
jgi:phospho-N-acetylmuramoyl-pentapeptide-transferase